MLQSPKSAVLASDPVRFLNLTGLHAPHNQEFLLAIRRVIDASEFVGGRTLQQFETDFAAWVGPHFYAVGCANGTDAITLASRALDLPPDSEAIIPAMTFFATVEGLINAGLKIRLVDVSAGSWTMETDRTSRPTACLKRSN